MELGVSPNDENTPLMFNYTTINATTHEKTEYILCLKNFMSQPPPPSDLTIPDICRQGGMSNRSIPESGNQRFLPSYFATPPAIHAPAMAAWLRNAH